MKVRFLGALVDVNELVSLDVGVLELHQFGLQVVHDLLVVLELPLFLFYFFLEPLIFLIELIELFIELDNLMSEKIPFLF